MQNAAYFIAAQTEQVVPLAVGIPGAAKTSIIKQFARRLGRRCYIVIGSIRDPADIAGYPFPGNNGSPFVELIPPRYVHDIVAGEDKWVLFWDEITTVSPAVQAAMLRPIAEWVVGDVALPGHTIQLAAANPPGCAANGFELEPPMANRLCHLRWSMDWASWDAGMLAGGDFPLPEIPILPENWRRGIGRVATQIVAFRRHKPGVFSPKVDSEGNMDEDRAMMGAAWPSPRSIHNGAVCLAAADSVGADDDTKFTLLSGCAGHGFAIEFFEWQRHLDLPDPNELLQEFADARKQKREPEYEHPDRPDKLIAMLGAVTQAAIEQDDEAAGKKRSKQNRQEQWLAACMIFEQAAKRDIDVALTCTKQLFNHIPQGVMPDPSFIKTVLPTMQKCLY